MFNVGKESFKLSNDQIGGKKSQEEIAKCGRLEMKINFALILDYLNPASNNRALTPVVQMLYSAVDRINLYPVDEY